jgi:hypothetical protein
MLDRLPLESRGDLPEPADDAAVALRPDLNADCA